jgi:hypothetical protein
LIVQKIYGYGFPQEWGGLDSVVAVDAKNEALILAAKDGNCLQIDTLQLARELLSQTPGRRGENNQRESYYRTTLPHLLLQPETNLGPQICPNP